MTLQTLLPQAVGQRTATAFERAFDMVTVADLLAHVPRKYSRRGDLTPLTGLPLGEQVTVVAQVLDVRVRQMQRKRGTILEARITDGQGTLTLTFFNQRGRERELFAGRRGIFTGKVQLYRGQPQLQHPEYELFADGADAPGAQQLDEAAARAWSEQPVPIYAATSQLPSWTIQKTIGMVLGVLDAVQDPLPTSLRSAEGILPLHEALQLAHQPQTDADWKSALASLRFREAFTLQLAFAARRQQLAHVSATARPLPQPGGFRDRFDQSLPFQLTSDQQQAGALLARELASNTPMHRLLQGEVGSGKTLVALRAMLQLAESDAQSALIAPTEVLAAQHFRSITQSLGEELAAQVQPVLLTGKMPVAQRRRALLAIASGASKLVIGTHALISEGVTFADLGLIIIDEQHRFGVEQREALRQKGTQPHVLAMTATPIPRTVVLTVFGDLEVVTLRQLPEGRQGIETFAVPEEEMPRRAARVWERAIEEIAAGRQVYVVCPAISATSRDDDDAPSEEPGEESESTAGSERPLANVTDTLSELQGRPEFAGITMEVLHGALPGAEKDRVMRSFAAGETQLLIATTVIEVGVNVPNASLMIVRDADRFGISQLHQLRGRVGRGEHPGLCLLMTHAAEGSVARARIDAVAETNDGFALAEIDVTLRREGDILGTAQSGGKSTLKLLRVAEHGDLIAHTRTLVDALFAQDPQLSNAPGLAALVEQSLAAGDVENLAKS